MERLELLGYYACHHTVLVTRLTRATRFVAEYHLTARAAAGATEEVKGAAAEELAQVRAGLCGCAALRDVGFSV